jgi:hypothetical protein
MTDATEGDARTVAFGGRAGVNNDDCGALDKRICFGNSLVALHLPHCNICCANKNFHKIY